MLALIKKDKPESELRDSMTNQMEVFLQENTQSFIESLFTTLQSGDYVDGPPKGCRRFQLGTFRFTLLLYRTLVYRLETFLIAMLQHIKTRHLKILIAD